MNVIKWKLKAIVSMLFLATVCVWHGPEPLWAAEKALSARPKLGLALGGGSARGFAHIGVLRWMEENHIPVDYVAGTSMGGLIGGLYAMGMSPAQIEQLVTEIDWDQLFQSNPPFKQLSFRRKEDRLDYPAEIELGLRDKIYLPNGLPVYRVNLLISRLALPYSLVDHFDQLPIPFRCVATDIRHSQRVILENGSLAVALRATMSIPGAFVPIERDGQLLVDGGLVNNVPADVAKSMGADRIIAVNCNEDNENKDMRGLGSVLMGSFNTVVVDNTTRALNPANLVLYPEMTGLSGMEWKKAGQFIAAGYQAAALQAETLRKFAVDENTWTEYLRERALRKPEAVAVPEMIEVQGTNALNQVRIKKTLSRFVGQKIEPLKLEAALIEILGSDFYESLRYEMGIFEQKAALVITVKEKAYGPPFIRFIPETNFSEERTKANLHARINNYNLWGLNSELRTDLLVGTELGFKVELYKPIAESGWFWAPGLKLGHTVHSFYEHEVRQADYTKDEQVVGIDIGYTLNKYSEVRLGYQIGNQAIDTQLGVPVSSSDGAVSKAQLRWSYINITNESLLQGLMWDVKGDWYTKAPDAAHSFSTVETSLKWGMPVNDANSLVTIVAAGVATRGDAPLLQQFRLGGPFKMGFYAEDQLYGANYVLGTFGVMHHLGQPFGLGRMHLCILAENSGVFDSWSEIDCSTNLSIGLMGLTSFGNYYLGSSFDKNGSSRVALLMGRLF